MSAGELLNRAEVQWEALRTSRPELVPAVALQRVLVARIATALDELAGSIERYAQLDRQPLVGKLDRGTPALRGESIPLPIETLGPLLRDLCDALGRAGAGAAAEHILQAVERNRIDVGTLLGASLARDQRAVRTGANHLGLAPDLLWLVAELSVGPLAYLLQSLLGGESESPGDTTTSAAAMKSAIARWDRGYCWACGSWPAFTEIWQGERWPRCSFCGASWHMQSRRCTYCGENGHRFVTDVPHDQHLERQLELCGACRGYLKSTKVDSPTPFLLLAVEDLATTDLDLLAAHRGFERPSLPEIGLACAQQI